MTATLLLRAAEIFLEMLLRVSTSDILLHTYIRVYTYINACLIFGVLVQKWKLDMTAVRIQAFRYRIALWYSVHHTMFPILELLL